MSFNVCCKVLTNEYELIAKEILSMPEIFLLTHLPISWWYSYVLLKTEFFPEVRLLWKPFQILAEVH